LLQVYNIQFYPNIEWEDYCKLPGYSFSGIKSNGVALDESEGMRLGKRVHAYLLKPMEYDWVDAGVVIPIAREINSRIGTHLLRYMELECGVTATFLHEGLEMRYKGLLDIHEKRTIVVDLKVIAGDLSAYIKRFLYDQQVIGYGIPADVQRRLIVAFNKKTKQVQTAFVDYDPRWWCHQIKRLGKPV